MVKKMLAKSPLQQSLVNTLGWLDPSSWHDADKHEHCIKQAKKCLKVCLDARHVEPQQCDSIINQLQDAMKEHGPSPDFVGFERGKSRLDVLLHGALANRKECAELWSMVKKVLLLSHGQASVERGFSINKEVLTDNMSEHTLIALRAIKDAVCNAGGRPTDIVVTPELLTFAAGAHSRYQQHLADQRQKQRQLERGEKRKAVEEELSTLSAKRKLLEASANAMLSSADQFAEDAEKATKEKAMTLIAKSNAMRRSAKEKFGEVDKVAKEMAEKHEELKS